MATNVITDVNLSGGDSAGGGIAITADLFGPYTTIHTCHATAMDEVWLWAYNYNAAKQLLAVYFDATQALGYEIPPSSGLVLVVPGMCFTNSVVIAAGTQFAGDVNVFGHVNRIT